jgi:signal transduction histidine kinase
MQRVLEFFGADTCVLAQLGPDGEQYEVREATRFRPQGGTEVSPLLSGAGATTPLPRTAVAVYSEAGQFGRSGYYRILEPGGRTVYDQPAERARSAADWLKTPSFMAVPLRRHDVFRGYLCVGSFRTRSFKPEDALFLQQVSDQIMPVLEHIRLVDHLASDAADEERRRIARSIHDRIIQPYLGLQIGLKSVHQMIRSEVSAGEADASQGKWRQTVAALESLITMTRDGVAELRQYVYGLKQSGGGRAVLVDSIVRYASKFERATGIHVKVVDRVGLLDIQDRLAADIFQMATEALSNVRRHTTANAVTLVLETSAAGSVVLRVENEITEPGKTRAFRPGSISDRADALGGKTEVGVQDGKTVVRVEIPL